MISTDRLYSYIKWVGSIEGICFFAHMCNDMALCLSVLIVPLAIEDISFPDLPDDEELDSGAVAAQVSRVASMAFMGGAIGKFINGFVCDELGPYRCSRWYLVGMGVCNLIFSLSQSTTCMGLAFAGMEFFSSIQYAALSIMLSNYYRNDHARLTIAWTALGLASTIGDVLAKTLGSALNIWFHSWRRVAQFGTAVCFFGALVICQAPGRKAAEESHAQRARSFSWSRIGESLSNLLGTRLFWSLALSYAIVFVACYSDRLMVPFYNEMSGFSQEVCGGLTLSITFGLVHGLVTGSETYTHLHTVPDKRRFFRNRYLGNVLAICGMAGMAYLVQRFPDANPYAITTTVFFFSSAMASTMSFEFFQMPIIIAQKYESEKAVCISFLDGFGFLFSIPVFSALGVVVPKYGWSVAWLSVAAMSLIGGIVFVQNIGPILMTHADEHLSDENDLEFLYYYEWASNVYEVESFKAQAALEGIFTKMSDISGSISSSIAGPNPPIKWDHGREPPIDAPSPPVTRQNQEQMLTGLYSNEMFPPQEQMLPGETKDDFHREII
jgi:Major Facilitator Superfamily